MDSSKKMEILEKKDRMRHYCHELMYRIDFRDYLGCYELFEEMIEAYDTLQRLYDLNKKLKEVIGDYEF